LVIKETQKRPTINEAEVSALLNSMQGRYAVLVALVAGTGLRIGEALAVRTEDFDPDWGAATETIFAERFKRFWFQPA
jgi:integrase